MADHAGIHRHSQAFTVIRHGKGPYGVVHMDGRDLCPVCGSVPLEDGTWAGE